MSQLVLTTVRGLTDPKDPVPLDPERVCTIGRTGNLRVHDPLVSVRHAEIRYDPVRGGYVIRDLGSSVGTYVDGHVLKKDNTNLGEDLSRPIRVGSELRFGDTTVRVDRMRSAPIRAFAALSALLVVVLACSAFGLAVVRMLQSDEIVLRGNGRIWRADGAVDSVVVPPEYLWSRGLPWGLRIREISDFDDNDRSELWIDAHEEKIFVVTFGDDNEWIDLGVVPATCRTEDKPVGHLPILRCDDELWRIDEQTHKYAPFDHDGVVVWYREVPPRPSRVPHDKAKSEAPVPSGLQPLKPLQVARFSVKDTVALGQFFTDRGVYSKVHYVICEGAFDGLRAQALTIDGVVMPLQPGCIEELRMEGQVTGKPYAVAFTPAGWRALVDDVTTFYNGDPSGLFLDRSHEKVIEDLSEQPGQHKGAVKLTVESTNSGLPVPDPRAPNTAILTGQHELEPSDRIFVAAPLATTITIEGPGTYEYAVGGGRCERFKVTVRDFDQDSMLACSDSFVDVQEIGCDGIPVPVVSGRTGGGRWGTRVNDLSVVLDVERFESLTEHRVQHVRLSYRLPPK